MAKEPAARWSSATEFVDALAGALASRAAVPVAGSASADAGTTRVMAPTAGARRAAAAPVAAKVPPARRRVAWAALPLGLVAVALALGALLSASGGDSNTDADPAAPPAAETATPTAQATATPAQATPTAPAADDPAALNARGFELYETGRLRKRDPDPHPGRGRVPQGRGAGSLRIRALQPRLLAARQRRPRSCNQGPLRTAQALGDNDAGDVARELDAAYSDAGRKPKKSKGSNSGKDDDD